MQIVTLMKRNEDTPYYRKTDLTNRFAVVENKKETQTETVWQGRTEMKLVPGEKGDEDNQVCLQ